MDEPPFDLGLIVGKFAPLHLGHEWLIDTAAARCRRLLVLSYCNPEIAGCEPEIRERWLCHRFPAYEIIVLDPASLDHRCSAAGAQPRPLPLNSASDEIQQLFLAWLLRDVLHCTPDAFFCSEAYGPSCAALLTHKLGRKVTAVVVDPSRTNSPISATHIRAHVGEQQHWLSPHVRNSFVNRVAVLGGESSGKTTLAQALAAHFTTAWVPEYGRELWELQSGHLDESDLLKIAHEQIARETRVAPLAHRYLFCDTSPLTTAGYGGWMFGRVDPALDLLATRPYGAIVLCQSDFPFVQDGTRRDRDFSLRQYEWYQARLREMNCPVLEVFGTVDQRVAAVEAWLATV